MKKVSEMSDEQVAFLLASLVANSGCDPDPSYPKELNALLKRAFDFDISKRTNQFQFWTENRQPEFEVSLKEATA